ncbi:MAG: MFS transporter, partial [Burkholderiaceae bacterium]
MQDPRYAWVVVWAAFVSLAVIFGVAYSFAAFFESFSHAFNARRADVSLVFALCGGVYFVLGAFGGMLSDRFGPRAVCCSGMVLIAAGLGLSSVAESMATIYAAYGVGVGIGIALVYTPAIGCVPPWFTARRGFAAG